MSERLLGYRILILETREEAQFARLLSEQGADVLQCPMFTIEDAPDPAPLLGWIEGVISAPPDDLVLMTGEGLRRLLKLAASHKLDQRFIAALAHPRIFARGPKPVKALREIGLQAYRITDKPTSEGIAEMLAQEDLSGHRLGLQLYPEKDHMVLISAIEAQGAEVIPVSPYIYNAHAADTNIIHAIQQMADGHIDAIALTSSGQVRRLIDTARKFGCDEQLRKALLNTPVASVGPVVTVELQQHGLRADIMPPDGAYFMKPLISAMASYLAQHKPGAHAQRD